MTSRQRIGTGPVLFARVVFAICLASGTSSRVVAEEAEPVLTGQITEADSNIASGTAVVVLDKGMDEVLPIVVGYARYVEFMPNFTKSRVLAQRGTRARVYVEVSVAKGVITLWGQLNIAERQAETDERVVEATLLEGNIDAFTAKWKLTPMNGGAKTRVEFTLYVDPDMPLPASVFSRENERAAGRTLEALRLRVSKNGETT